MNSTSLFKRTEVIGRGRFGVVYKAYNKHTKQVVAIKVLNLDTQEDEVADVQQEIQFLAELKNVPNVTHYYGSILNDTRLWIIMDYCAGGSVRTLLKAGVFEEKYIAVIARELLIGLSAVHKIGVIHRDLKAANILISKEGNVQLCDFGVAAKVTSNSLKRTTMAGTPYWMAPEVIREGDTYNSKADIWSLGITLYEIATGNPPYCEKDAMWAMQMISKSTPPRLEGRDYSASLKEAIALCLDESPEERLLADDLLKCKLIRFYKNHSTFILKEVISRYLLWRDNNNRRDSTAFVSLDKELGHEPQPEPTVQGDNNIQVKWDFDSLSSREYIIENEIDLNQVENQIDSTYDLGEYKNPDAYQTEPTLRADTNLNLTEKNYPSSQNFTNDKTSRQTPVPNNGIPKSLQSLFEESPEISSQQGAIPSNFELPPPTLAGAQGEPRMESPTIEIPDIDKLQNLSAVSSATSQIASLNGQPHLNKPPALYHSQSASGNLETRFANSSQPGNRPRKKTISNSFGSNSNSQNNYFSAGVESATPHTPPYSTLNNNKSPSPKPPPNTGLIGNNGTNSPSKSMKALQSNSNPSTNPLLQPINFKASDNHTASNQNTVSNNNTNGTSLAMANNQKQRKPRPGLHIQMPTPSNTMNPLSALTNNSMPALDGYGHHEGTNQFGVKPSQFGSVSMTPVTEKDSFVSSGDNYEKTESTQASRDRAESLGNINPRHPVPQRKMTAPTLQTPSSFSITKHLGPSMSPSGLPKNKFPLIPNINGEFFIDSTPKQKLIAELDSMIKLFNTGLDALEEKI